MIGTPNSGSPVSVWYFTGCPPGSDSDLFPGSAATLVVDRPHSTRLSETGSQISYVLLVSSEDW
jgi:hypothetical protein